MIAFMLREVIFKLSFAAEVLYASSSVDKTYILKKMHNMEFVDVDQGVYMVKQPYILFFIGICLGIVCAQELHHNMNYQENMML